MNRITILDTTLRDGELTDGVSFTAADRVAIASLLAEIGVDVIEVAVSDSAGSQMEGVRAVVGHVRTSTICVLTPSSPDAIDAAGDALRGAATARIHVYQGVSREDDASRAESMVRRARGFVGDVEFTPANGARADVNAVAAVVRAALRAGATTINVADTAGRALPEDLAQRLRELHARVPELASACVSFHGHDDLGLATANSLAAIRAGARQVEVAVNGLGARAGNAPLEEIVAALREHGDALNAYTRVEDSRLVELSRLVEERSGLAISAQKAIVGRSVHWVTRQGR